MDIIMMKTGDLRPYEDNPRSNDEAVAYLKKSLSEFGFTQPILIDPDHVIIAGHTRLKAAIELGIDMIPVVIAHDLTPDQIRAYRLIDNKSAEQASWDEGKLLKELKGISLSFDMKPFKFDLKMDSLSLDDLSMQFGQGKKEQPYGAARERTMEQYRLGDFVEESTEGWYQMPTMTAVQHIPTRLIGFNYLLSSEEYDAGIHFYIDDYQFERIWRRPEKYMERLAMFDCALTPDFSLYMDMPRAMKVWNIYRSRLIGQMMQRHGITAIPTLSWAEEETFEFCFDGLERGGVVSVSTVGVKQSEEATAIWNAGMTEAMRRLEPSCVVVYGGDIGYDFGAVEAVHLENEVLTAWNARNQKGEEDGR